MPELPEVETVKNGLSRLLLGRQVAAVDYDWPKSFPNSVTDVNQFLLGSKIIDVRRRAKILMIDLSSHYSLVIHLKMTGQLVYRGSQNFGAGHPTDSLIGELPDKSTRVTLKFKDKSRLFFNDQRKFGWVRLMPTLEIPNIDFMRKVGPEPLDDDFTADDFRLRLLRRKNTNVKAALLDQTVVAGIGNIYADESLFAAKIHPASIIAAIPPKKLAGLYQAVRRILTLGIEKGGSTDRNYVNAEGKRGSYTDFALVFRRQNLPCPNCQHEIIKIRVAGRGTHICPHCQKFYGGSNK
jgi:formamidopyrimidine-DNA glycosylase